MTQPVNLRRLGIWCGGVLLLALLLWLSALPSLPGVWAQEDPRPTPTNVGTETPIPTETATESPTPTDAPTTPPPTTPPPTESPTTPAPTTEPGTPPTEAPAPPPPQPQPQAQPAPDTQAPAGVTTVPQTGLLDSAGAPVALLALILTIGIFGARRLRKHPNSSDLR